MSDINKINRRDFIKLGLGGATLALGFHIPTQAKAAMAGPGQAGGEVVGESLFSPNAFLRIDADNTVTVVAKHLEMGQGTYTGLATLVAEELDAAWDQVKVIGAPADNKRYNNLFWGPAQGTGGSTAMANSWEQMRKAGASARAMVVQAAANRWSTTPANIQIRDGVVSGPDGKSASLGELAADAAQLEAPSDVSLKYPDQFRLIGKGVPRKDTADKLNGTAIYTQDIKLPGMLTALVAHPPRFGAKPGRVDASASLKIDGVVEVVTIPSGVAVLGKDFWSAKQGRDALQVQWDESEAFRLGSREIFQQFAKLADEPGAEALKTGDAEGTLASAGEVVSAEFRYPYLAHAAMEPMNCVVHREGDHVTVWNGEQMQTVDQANVAGVFGLKPEQVTLHMLYAGGSFGRRANPGSDYILEAANIAHGLKNNAPVKLVWTREDDTRAGWYRPLNLHRMRASLDANGMPEAWQHRIVGQSIVSGTPFQGMIQNGIDPTSVEGASNQPYQVPNQWVDLHSPTLPVPVQWWRSVGSTHTAFSVETFIDELAAKAGQDPVEYRLALMPSHPRHSAVLKLAADKAGWGGAAKASDDGRPFGRGVAVHESFNSVVAMVADVSVDQDGNNPKVHKVVIAVDCGIAINPDIVVAQMEGGMGYGLAMALGSEITLDQGRVVQSNFHDYVVPRLPDMPDVEVHILPSGNPPTGVGEPATPVIAPAVANAIAAATGVRHHSLPLRA
ncbi:MAG: molybdopterin cofactor-binding domain-containing protein [Gammaproteobacteria bacterium]